MASTPFKLTYKKPIPENAEILTRKGQKYARFEDARGKRRVWPLNPNDDTQMLVRSQRYYFNICLADGTWKRVKGFTDRAATQQEAAKLEREIARRKAGIVDGRHERLSQQQRRPILEHLRDYYEHMKNKGVSDWHFSETIRRLDAILKSCNPAFLNEIEATAVERWLNQLANEGTGARTRNTYLGSLKAFLNWCVDTGRLLENPLQTVKEANCNADVRRKRRALTEDELRRLVSTAKKRPLRDALMIRRGKNKGKLLAKVRPKVREKLTRLGYERALIYKILVLTGLRRGELASLTWRQIELSGTTPSIQLRAEAAKNRKGEGIILRGDLVADLRRWRTMQDEPAASGKVFHVPGQLVAILDRDLKAAGIPKVDERGRSVDVHAMRTSAGTYASRSGAPISTVKSFMRHSKIDLTLEHYDDLKLHDVHHVLDALPEIPLNDIPDDQENVLRATGTDDTGMALLHRQLHQDPREEVQNGAIPRKQSAPERDQGCSRRIDVTGCDETRKAMLPSTCNRSSSKRVMGLEPTTFSLEG